MIVSIYKKNESQNSFELVDKIEMEVADAQSHLDLLAEDGGEYTAEVNFNPDIVVIAKSGGK